MAQSSLITRKNRELRALLTELVVALDTSTGHDHDGTDSKSITASVTYGVLGDMAAAGTGTANVVGTANAARVDHVHALGTHVHSGATTGGQIGPAAFAAGAFTADAPGRAPFAAGLVNAAMIGTGAVETAKLAAGALSADVTGRAVMATGYFTAAKTLDAFAANAIDATAAEAIIADSAIPSDKVNWTFGTPGNITPDDTAGAGTAGGPARSDHQHGITAAAPSAGLAAADAEGAATTFARSNHVHKATVADQVSFTFGDSDDASMRWSTSDADNHALVVALGASKAVHVTDAITTDWNVAADSHPTVYIHSNTTPATDYVKLSHDGTTATIQAVGGTLDLTGVGSVTVNEASADIDFRVETADIANGLVCDAGANAFAFGGAGNQDTFVRVTRPARSAQVASTTYADLALVAGGTFTTENNTITYTYVASVALSEPNITKGATDTVTVAATLYIADAPTEGATNAALYVAAGDASFATATMRGTLTVAAQSISLSTGNITFSGAGYIAMGVTPADAGYIRLPNTQKIAWRNVADNGNITLEVDAGGNLAIGGGSGFLLNGAHIYGDDTANADLKLYGTGHGTVTTAYIIANQMIDATIGSVALRVNAGAVGDGGGGQTSLNGETVWDSTNGRLYGRYGAAWHYIAITAGFQVSSWESACPVCGKELAVGEAVGGVIDRVLADGARHGLYAHLGCLAAQKGIAMPYKGEAPRIASATVFPSARERAELGLEKEGSKLVPVTG